MRARKEENEMLDAMCPCCGAKLEIDVDLSQGPPNEVGTECDCGAIPVWHLDWGYALALGEFKHDEREFVAKGGRKIW